MRGARIPPQLDCLLPAPCPGGPGAEAKQAAMMCSLALSISFSTASLVADNFGGSTGDVHVCSPMFMIHSDTRHTSQNHQTLELITLVSTNFGV